MLPVDFLILSEKDDKPEVPSHNYRLTNIVFGSRVGAVVKALASHQCGPASIPGLDVSSYKNGGTSTFLKVKIFF